jgi:hypothetical protein
MPDNPYFPINITAQVNGKVIGSMTNTSNGTYAYANWATVNDLGHSAVFGNGSSQFEIACFRDRAYVYGDAANGVVLADAARKGIFFAFSPAGGGDPVDTSWVNADGSYNAKGHNGIDATVQYQKPGGGTGTLTFVGGLLTAAS